MSMDLDTILSFPHTSTNLVANENVPLCDISEVTNFDLAPIAAVSFATAIRTKASFLFLFFRKIF